MSFTHPTPSRASIKARVGTPLEDVHGLGDDDRKRLRALSVATAEELLGLIAADPEATNHFLQADLPQVQADMGGAVSGGVLAQFAEAAKLEFALGAAPPEGVEVEERAGQHVFDSYFEAGAQAGRTGDETPGVSLIDCFGPPRNQADRGTCVAHAVCALLECLRKRKTGDAIDHSEQFAYWNAKQHDGHPDSEGTFIEVALPVTEADGVCQETDWPYNPAKVPGNESQGPPPDAAGPAAKGFLTATSEKLAERDPARLRDVLDADRPVAISIPVYDSWYRNPDTHLYGFISMPLPTSLLRGGHAMCIAGYDWDEGFAGGGYFILRNSWGTEWAPESPLAPGYGALPFLYAEKYAWEAFSATV